MWGVLLGVALLIIVLQLSPTSKRAPNPIVDLHATLVTSHSVAVAWKSVDTYANGLRYFAVQITSRPESNPLRGAALVGIDAGSKSGLTSGTSYVISVTSVATNGAQSKPTVLYVVTKSFS